MVTLREMLTNRMTPMTVGLILLLSSQVLLAADASELEGVSDQESLRALSEKLDAGLLLLSTEAPDQEKVIRKGGPRSPMTFHASPSQNFPDQGSLQALTEKLVGKPCPSLAYEWGVLTDETPLGIESQQENVWHIAGAMVNVSGMNGDVIDVAIHLIVDGKSHRLIVAFTESKEVWIWPALDDSLAQTAEETASGFRLSIQELDRPLAKNLGEVLSAVQNRIDVGTAGQIVLRPRTILSQYPPVDVGPDGKGSPNDSLRILDCRGSWHSPRERLSGEAMVLQ